MIRLEVHIEKYDWKVTILIGADIEYIVRCLRSLYCDDSYIRIAINNITKCTKDCAITISNQNMQESVININKYSDEFELLDTIVHECRHIESHIATKYNLNEKGESVAYLIGHLVKDVVKGLAGVNSSTGDFVGAQ